MEPRSTHPPALAADAAPCALLLLAAGLGGALAGALAACGAAGLIALGLGGGPEQLGFTVTAGIAGACCGVLTAIWLAIRLRRPEAAAVRLVLAGLAAASAVALALHALAFVVLAPRPQAEPFMSYEIRVAPGRFGTEDAAPYDGRTRVLILAGTEVRGSTPPAFARDEQGRDLLRGGFWLVRHRPAEAIVLHRPEERPVRFTLKLPADPPTTAHFTEWLGADAAGPAGERVELRLRVDRRVRK